MLYTTTAKPLRRASQALLRTATGFGILDLGCMRTVELVQFSPGDRVGRLLLLSKRSGAKGPLWTCLCDCGTQREFRQGNLRRNTKSCGCLAKELTAARGRARTKPPVPCCIDGCDKMAENKSGGMCGMHAQRVRRYGDPHYVTSEADWKRLCREAHLKRVGDNVKPTTYRKLHNRHAHRVIAEQMLGRPLKRGEIVHHVDGNKHNNDPSNLQVMTQSEHVKLHLKEMIATRWGQESAAKYEAKDA